MARIRRDTALGVALAATVSLAATVIGAQIAAAPPAPAMEGSAAHAAQEPGDRTVARASRSAAAPEPVSCAGAAAMANTDRCPADAGPAMTPTPAEAPDDYAGNGYAEGCWATSDFGRFRTCTFGAKDAKRHIALVGNSHAAQWLLSLRRMATTHDLRITTYLIPKCAATTERIRFSDEPTPELTDRCHQWGQWAQKMTNEGEYDLVITSERTYLRPDKPAGRTPYEAFRDGYAEYLAGWTRAGTDVLVIRDTPVPGSPVPACLEENGNDASACTGGRADWLPPDPLVDAARSVGSEHVNVVNLSRYFCAESCPPIVGGVLAYRDHSHITSTFADTVLPYLDPLIMTELRAAVRR